MASDPPYLFVHIPKTAGTSFRLAVEQAFDGRVAYDYARKATETSDGVRRFVYDRKDMAGLDGWLAGERSVMLGGHFHFAKYAALFPPERVITFLREPLARIVSEHEHALRHHGFDGTLLDFASKPRNQNLQSGMLEGVPLEAAAFVGITERYGESLRLLKRRLGWELPALVRNVNPRATQLAGSYPLEPDVEEQLKAWNPLDIALYERACSHLSACLGSLKQAL